jgi:RHS repeat-associated protein
LVTNFDGELIRHSKVVYDPGGIMPSAYSVWTGTEFLETKVYHDPGTGLLLTSVDPNNLATRWSYDGFGRLRTAESPETGSTHVEVRPVTDQPSSVIPVEAELEVSVVSSTGSNTVTQYDSAGNPRRRRTLGIDGFVDEEWGYDQHGSVRQKARPHLPGVQSQGVVQIHRDQLHRVTRVVEPETQREWLHMYTPAALLAGSYVGFADDDAETVSAVLDPIGRLAVSASDAGGKTIARFDSAGDETSVGAPMGFAMSRYQYGGGGLLREAVDPAGNITAIYYDQFGRVDREESPDAGTRRYDYYPTGELRRVAHGGDQRWFSFSYDNLGRPTSRLDDDGSSSWTYDGSAELRQKGRLVSSTSNSGADGSGTVQTLYEYGPSTGRLSKITQRIREADYETGFDYYESGLLRTLKYPRAANRAFDLRYDYERGQLVNVRDPAGASFWRLTERYQGYLPALEELGNGRAEHREYDPLTGELGSISLGRLTGTGSGSLVADRTLSYDYFADGRVRAETLSNAGVGESRAFAYDPLARLKTVTRRAGTAQSVTEEYSYSVDGRLEAIGIAPSLGAPLAYRGYQYLQGPHRVSDAGPDHYEYDDSGNQTLREGPSVAGGVQTIAYTPFNKPVEVKTGSDPLNSTFFSYDADQNRVLKINHHLDTMTVFTGGAYQRESTVSGAAASAKHTYKIYVGDRLVAEIDRFEVDGASDPGADQVRYIHPDRLGSPRTVSNDDGDVVSSAEFTAFGQLLSGAMSTTVGFTGQRRDDDLGLLDYNARLYDPSLGQFLSADPIVAAPFATQGLNRYSYVLNDPMNLVDPTGMQSEGTSCGFWQFLCDLIDSSPGDSGHDGGGGGPDDSDEPIWMPKCVPDAVGNGCGKDAREWKDDLRAATTTTATHARSDRKAAAVPPPTPTRSRAVGGNDDARADATSTGGGMQPQSMHHLLSEPAIVKAQESAQDLGEKLNTFLEYLTYAMDWFDGQPGPGPISALGIKRAAKEAAEQAAARGLWKITKEGTERAVRHRKFGTFSKSKSDGLWWSRDQAGHGGSKWKVFEETSDGLKWKADADEFGDFITGKHKSEIGQLIPWPQLNAVNL